MQSTQTFPKWFNKNEFVLEKPEHSFVLHLLNVICLIQKDQIDTPKESEKFLVDPESGEKAKQSYQVALNELASLRKVPFEYKKALKLMGSFHVEFKDYFDFLDHE